MALKNSLRRVGAIDIGSNSTHLVVGEIDEHGHVHVLDARKEQTKLAGHLDTQGDLTDEGQRIVTAALDRMAVICGGYQAEIEAVATFALRKARNQKKVCKYVREKTGIQVSVISGQQEARLIYQGVKLGLNLPEMPVLVLDIGGGSTEVILCDKGRELFCRSLELGCVSLSFSSFSCEIYAPKEMALLEREIAGRLDENLMDLPGLRGAFAVCSSGTARAVKELALGLRGQAVPEVLHGMDLTLDEIDASYQALLQATTPKKRKSLPNIDQRRADILLAGCMILRAFSKRTKIKRWVLSLYALREGVLASHADGVLENVGRKTPADIRKRTTLSLCQRFHVDLKHASQVAMRAAALARELNEFHSLDENWRSYLDCAAYLHEAGRFIRFNSFHKHSYYLIRNVAFPGCTHVEQECIALIARFHRRKLPSVDKLWEAGLDPVAANAVCFCAALLRLAALLEHSRSQTFKDARADLTHRGIDLFLEWEDGARIESEQSFIADEVEALSMAFGKGVHLHFI